MHRTHTDSMRSPLNRLRASDFFQCCHVHSWLNMKQMRTRVGGQAVPSICAWWRFIFSRHPCASESASESGGTLGGGLGREGCATEWLTMRSNSGTNGIVCRCAATFNLQFWHAVVNSDVFLTSFAFSLFSPFSGASRDVSLAFATGYRTTTLTALGRVNHLV
jgi:hypothetical protein